MSTWSYRGTSLDDLGIVTLVWDSAKMPTRRGENILIPFRNGRVFIAKYYEQRSISLGLEIVQTSIEELEDAVDTVKRLLGQRTLGALQQTMASGAVRIAQAESFGDLAPLRTSPFSSKLTLDFILPDPFFYSNVLTAETAVIDASPTLFTVPNNGTVEHRDVKITLTGPLENTVITNTTNGVSLTYNGAIAGGEVVVIQTNDTGEYIATKDGVTDVIGNISHAGSSALMIISTDDNEISVTDGIATTGTVKIEFYPPYL